MKESAAVYLGKIVSKENFRVFIYAPNGLTKLVESWDEYEKLMQTGLWFATSEDALCSTHGIDEKNEKTKKRQKSISNKSDEIVKEESQLIDEKDITTDDFLPKLS